MITYDSVSDDAELPPRAYLSALGLQSLIIELLLGALNRLVILHRAVMTLGAGVAAD